MRAPEEVVRARHTSASRARVLGRVAARRVCVAQTCVDLSLQYALQSPKQMMTTRTSNTQTQTSSQDTSLYTMDPSYRSVISGALDQHSPVAM